MSNAIKKTKSSLLALLLLTGATVAQPVDLSGAWLLRGEQGNSYRVNITRVQGHSWSGTAAPKAPVTLKLNPSGLQNEWVGDLELQGKHSVKAALVDGNTLKLKELSGPGHWSLVKAEE